MAVIYRAYRLSDHIDRIAQRRQITDFPDLLCVKRGKIILVEVKFGKAKLSEGQQRFFYSAQVLGFPAYVVRDVKGIELMDQAEFGEERKPYRRPGAGST